MKLKMEEKYESYFVAVGCGCGCVNVIQFFPGCFSCRNDGDDDELYVSKQQAFCEHVSTLEFCRLCFSTVFVSLTDFRLLIF
jgi:hypothetical protein